MESETSILEDPRLGTRPAPFIIEPKGEHRRTVILLHGTSTSGEIFGREWAGYRFWDGGVRERDGGGEGEGKGEGDGESFPAFDPGVVSGLDEDGDEVGDGEGMGKRDGEGLLGRIEALLAFGRVHVGTKVGVVKVDEVEVGVEEGDGNEKTDDSVMTEVSEQVITKPEERGKTVVMVDELKAGSGEDVETCQTDTSILTERSDQPCGRAVEKGENVTRVDEFEVVSDSGGSQHSRADEKEIIDMLEALERSGLAAIGEGEETLKFEGWRDALDEAPRCPGAWSNDESEQDGNSAKHIDQKEFFERLEAFGRTGDWGDLPMGKDAIIERLRDVLKPEGPDLETSAKAVDLPPKRKNPYAMWEQAAKVAIREHSIPFPTVPSTPPTEVLPSPETDEDFKFEMISRTNSGDSGGVMNYTSHDQTQPLELKTIIDAFPNTRWVFPSGTFKPITALGGRVTNAWFDIHDFSDRTVGEDDQRGNITDSIVYLHGLLKQEFELLNSGRSEGEEEIKVIFGGFSQGCAMGSICVLSGFFGVFVDRFIGMSGWLPFIKQVKYMMEEWSLNKFSVMEDGVDWSYQRKLFAGSYRDQWAGYWGPVTVRIVDEITILKYKTVNHRAIAMGRVDVDKQIEWWFSHGMADEKVKIEWQRELRGLVELLHDPMSWREVEGLGHDFKDGGLMRGVVEFLEKEIGNGNKRRGKESGEESEVRGRGTERANGPLEGSETGFFDWEKGNVEIS